MSMLMFAPCRDFQILRAPVKKKKLTHSSYSAVSNVPAIIGVIQLRIQPEDAARDGNARIAKTNLMEKP